MEWYILVLISAVFLTLQHLLQKKVLFKEHATEYLTVFCLLMWIILLPFASLITFRLDALSLLLLYVISALSLFTWLPWIRAYRHMEISTVEPLRNIGPMLVIFLAMLFLGERLDLIHFGGIVLFVLGSYFLEAAVFRVPFFQPLQLLEKKYIGRILFSMIVGSIVAVLSKMALRSVDALTFLFFVFFIASVHMLIVQSIKYQGVYDVLKVVKKDWKLLLLIVGSTLLSDYVYVTAIAMPTTLISLAVPLRRLSTLFVTVIGGELFHEHKIFQKAMACVVMLLGSYLLIL